jgi:hypothetical protein
MDNRNYGYVVLNACRGLMYARDARLKRLRGPAWAKRAGTAPAGLVDVALARQEGAALRVSDMEATRQFVAHVRDELLSAAESKPPQ